MKEMGEGRGIENPRIMLRPTKAGFFSGVFGLLCEFYHHGQINVSSHYWV